MQLFTDDDYSEFVDEATFSARPDHEAELNYFKEPRNGRVISAKTLLSFVDMAPFMGGQPMSACRRRRRRVAHYQPPLHHASHIAIPAAACVIPISAGIILVSVPGETP